MSKIKHYVSKCIFVSFKLIMAQSADAYFIGRIEGASGFTQAAFCRFWFVNGTQWRLVSGLALGQTQTDKSGEDSDIVVWSHPIDAYYEFTGIQGWPKLSFQVWQHDELGRSYLGGYAFCPLPMEPGNHKIDVDIWRPIGTSVEELTAKYIGGSPLLKNQEMAHLPADRYKLKSETVGKLHLDINLILGRTSAFQIAF